MFDVLPGRYKDSPSRIPPFGVPSRGGPGGGPGGAPGGPPGGPPRGAPRAPGGPRARKFPEIPPGPPGPPGGPRRGHFGGFSGLLHRALDRIWGVSRGGRFPAQFVPKMAKKKFNLSRLGELLNTLRNVHPRPPGGVPGGPPGGAPRGPPGGGSWGWVSGGVQGPPDMTPLDNPRRITPGYNHSPCRVRCHLSSGVCVGVHLGGVSVSLCGVVFAGVSGVGWKQRS